MERTLVLGGGTVFTAEAAAPRAEAVAIRGERVLAVGPAEEVRAAAGPGAQEIDCAGCTVLPGFIDAHNHFLATGEELGGLQLRYPGTASIEDVVRQISEAAQHTPRGGWVRGSGMDHAKFPGGRPPTRHDLDRAAPDHPVAIWHVSGHFVLANSAAMDQRGLGDNVPDPPGGTVVRDEGGHPTGMFLDAACGLIVPTAVDIGNHGPNFHLARPLDELLDDLDRASREYLAAGLTTVGDAQVTSRELAAYREARARGRLPIRVACMLLSHQLRELRAIGLAPPFGDDRLWICALKVYADGSLIGGTAAFEEPYGEHGEFPGLVYHEPEALDALIGEAHAAGWVVGTHTQGDRAHRLVLDAYEAAHREAPRDVRHRIEHAGAPSPGDVRRIADLGVSCVVQPSYLRDSGDEFLVRLGERAHRLQPLREMLEAGAEVVLSSDAYVASYRPLDTVAAAIERRTRRGAPIGADHALRIEEALLAHTIVAARAIGAEDRLGSLRPGKLADVVIVEGDLLSAPPERIRELRVRTTIVGGEVVFRAG